MARSRRIAFLPRRDYKLRRLHDAARLLPLFGLLLIVMPILWSPPGEVERRTASDGLYLFGVWTGLIVLAVVFARGLVRPPPDPPNAPAAPEDSDAL